MRIYCRRVLLLPLLLLSCSLFSHINTGQIPEGLKAPLAQSALAEIELSLPPLQQQRIASPAEEKRGTAFAFGYIIPVQITAGNSGAWSMGKEGNQIWRVSLTSSGALGCILYFSRLDLPIGSQLYVYNPDGSVIFGPYTHEDNPSGGAYAIGTVYGETAIVEYVAPNVKSASGGVENRIPAIEIDGYSHVYREVMDLRTTNGPTTKNYGGSQSCEVNVNCTEGDDWREAQRGVARIIWTDGIKTYYCTGSLVNNTANDGTPYFLTADHCGGEVSVGNFSRWLFYFNFESANCINLRPLNTRVVTGCTRKARGPLQGGSDFLLLELNTTSANVAAIGGVYNGWDKSGATSTGGVSIHHPNGDIKKISTYTKPLSSVTYRDDRYVGAASAHWTVQWSETTNGHGVTEGGSSGSPLLNSEGLIVGTLSGGSSSCWERDKSDFYGKMSYHWASNGTSPDAQLQSWLNPTNSAEDSCPFYDPTTLFQATPSDHLFETIAGGGKSLIKAGLSPENWLATSNVEWLSIWPAEGKGSGRSTTVALTAKVNYEEADRIGIITVTHGGKEAKITVTQKGYGSITYGFESDFESYSDFDVDNFGTYTTVDVDGSITAKIKEFTFPNETYVGAFIPFNPTATTLPQTGGEWAAHSGTKYAACFSAVISPSNGGYGPNNDWLITPLVYLRKNSRLSFWAKSLRTPTSLDGFNVYVSTTNNSISSFEKISSGNYTETTTVWKEQVYDLSAYDGKAVYVAIQCVSENRSEYASVFMLDDLKIDTDTTDIAQNLQANPFVLYPNPTHEMVVIERNHEQGELVRILNVTGSVIRTDHIVGRRKVLAVGDLPIGVYYIQVGNKVQKLLKR